jgi:filamentous hemagglutinin family protein
MASFPDTGPRPSHLTRRLTLSSLLLLWVLLAISQAQITLDGSLGPPGPLAGPHSRIGAELGQIRGGNLFHSFGAFNVPTGGSATFTGPATIANILSRVTGGQPSAIDGALRSEIAGANLYLLNPSGVLFGPNASLDVSGSFHVSTADVLRLADGAKFQANLGQASVLTVAEPAAFGFLGSSPAAITIQGSSLRVTEGKALSVVGGDIEITGRGPLTTASDPSPTLGAPSGRVQLASVASPGEVLFSPLELAPDLRVDSFARLGRLEIAQGALLDASGVGAAGRGGPGGTVLIRSGRLLVDRSSILANTMGNVHGASLGLDLRIAADAVMTNASVLRSSPFAGGNGGDIVMSVGRLTLTDGSGIFSSSRGAGRGGDLTVTAREAIAMTGRDQGGNPSGLFSNAFRLGDGGRLFVSAPTLTMDAGEIEASTTEGSRGHAGGAEVWAGRLTLTGGARIDTSTSGSGRGGELRVAATDFSMDGGRITSGTLGGGNAGNLDMRVGRLTLTGGAQISTSTDGSGRGGELTVSATDAITIAGRDRGAFEAGCSALRMAAGMPAGCLSPRPC